MSTPFIGEIKLISWNYVPNGWAFCNGQLLPINQNQALFSLLGTMYGGNGQTNFALPDLRGRTPIHVGSGFNQGQRGGEEFHTLIQAEMPAHNHFVRASSLGPTQSDPTGAFWVDSGNNAYSTSNFDSTMNAGSISMVGGSQPHENRQPYLVINFMIALIGIFPSRN